MKLIVGVSGASGAPYAQRLLQVLAERDDVETHVVFTKTGRLVWKHEVGTNPKELGLPIYGPADMTAPMASGSADFDAMAVVPCSAGCMGRIAHGISADLVGRAADVMLKERKPLVLCVRETPFSLIHVRNMEQLLLAGARVMPAAPNFYSDPQSVGDLVDSVVGRVLDQLGIENAVRHRWEGM
jgi:4-hydroxy-3-polyprenylbenzoate decarboxylase